MTNQVAIALFLIVLAAIGLDLYQGWGGTLFLLRKGVDLIDWLKFWD